MGHDGKGMGWGEGDGGEGRQNNDMSAIQILKIYIYCQYHGLKTDYDHFKNYELSLKYYQELISHPMYFFYYN